MRATPDTVINQDNNSIQEGVYTWFEDTRGSHWLTDGRSFACFGSVFHPSCPMKRYFEDCCVTRRYPFGGLIMHPYTVTGREIVHDTVEIPKST